MVKRRQWGDSFLIKLLQLSERERKKNQQKTAACTITSFLQLVALNLNMVFHHPRCTFYYHYSRGAFYNNGILLSPSARVIIVAASTCSEVGRALYSPCLNLRFVHCWFYNVEEKHGYAERHRKKQGRKLLLAKKYSLLKN